MPQPLESRLDAFFASSVPDHLGVAVSGGSDSTALLSLLRQVPTKLSCVTVDHGLRADAPQEAEQVAALCARLDVPHTTLRWTGWDGKGNVQAEARNARYRLIADWAQQSGISEVALGHTQEDQAETVLMRLARGAGVDGLSAMLPRRQQHEITWLRPLLSAGREDLRRHLRTEGISWIEDPTNEDARFARIKARQSLDVLADLGITPAALAQVADNMAVARDALAFEAQRLARRHTEIKAGAVVIDHRALQAAPREIVRRVFLAALSCVNGAVYVPRRRTVEAALHGLQATGSATLDGCHALLTGEKIWVFREYQAVRDLTAAPDTVFDNRWRLTGPPFSPQSQLRPLGEAGLSACPDWRDLGVPRAALLPTPALWQGSTLLAAPVADPSSSWRATLQTETLHCP